MKRPYLFRRGGRPVVYFQPRVDGDVFLDNCSRDLTDKRLLQFFKPMDPHTDRRTKYGLYDESECRIIACVFNDKHPRMIDPRRTTDARIDTYFKSLASAEQDKLRCLAPLDGWLAAIIYPSIRIKNKAQSEGGEIQKLIRRIARTPGHAHSVEGDNLPPELDIDLCRHF